MVEEKNLSKSRSISISADAERATIETGSAVTKDYGWSRVTGTSRQGGPSASPPAIPLGCTYVARVRIRPSSGLNHLLLSPIDSPAGIPTQNPPLRTNSYPSTLRSNSSLQGLSGRSLQIFQPKRVPRGVAPLHVIWVPFPSVCLTDW